MAKAKKVVRHLTGKVDIKATLSQLRDPAQVKGPRQIGQVKRDISVRIGKVTRDEVVKRLDAAEAILTTGKIPAKLKGGAPKTKDATLSKAKGDLTKANKKLDAALARIEELTIECNQAHTRNDQLNSEKDPPVETPIPDPEVEVTEGEFEEIPTEKPKPKGK